MGAAIPFAPMIIGAGAGAMIDKKNPLRGAMLGAAGGSIAGPALSAATTGLTGAGASVMSGAQAAGIPMGAEQAAMLGAQAQGFGAAGVSNALSSAGANPMMAKALGVATTGPQGIFQAMSGSDLMKMGGKGLMNMAMQPQQQQPPMAAPQPPPRQAMPPQPMMPFNTGMRRRQYYGQ